jgi:hypothetical protein
MPKCKLTLSTFITLFSSLLSGCLSMSNIQANSNFELSPDEGIVIIAAPDNLRIAFHSGNIVENKFFDDELLPKGFVGNPESGYLIRKLKATNKDRGYGLTSLYTAEKQTYTAKCLEQEEMVLEVKPGVIQYYTDISFIADAASIKLSYNTDLNKAAEYIKQYFPKNTIPIALGNFKQVLKGTCYPNEITIPIYLPRIK